MITRKSFFYLLLLIIIPAFFFSGNSFLFRKKTVFWKNFSNLSFQKSHFSNRIIEQIRNILDVYINSWLLGILILVAIAISSPFLTEYVRKKFISSLKVEVLWIIIPTIILLRVRAPSIDFLYNIEERSKDKTQYSYKRLGYQWYWTYEFPSLKRREAKIIERYIDRWVSRDFVSYMAADNEIEVPLFFDCYNNITANDVIHSWAIPSLIIKTDAIPGRLNVVSFMVNSMVNEKHYGQCSELCGVNHSFIPIVLSTK